MDVVEIGLFQLENLILMRMPFTFVNVANRDLQSSDVKLNSYLVHAVKVHPDRVFEHFENLDKETPIVLICEDGNISRTKAQELETQGFSNIYLIDGGFGGLLRESGASSNTK